MSRALITVLLAAATFAPAALAQDPATAAEMSAQCAKNWKALESVHCSVEVTTELPTGRTVAKGECLFAGDRARVSMIDRDSAFSMLTVRDGRICWTEMRAPGDPPAVDVVKNFRGHFDYEHETLIGMVASTPILLHPARIFAIIARNYDLEFAGKRVDGKDLLVTLEGDLRPASLIEDLGRRLSADERRIIERLGTCRLSVRAEDFVPAKVEFYSQKKGKLFYALAFADYRTNRPVAEADFVYAPPAGVTVRDLTAMHQAQFRLDAEAKRSALPLADKSNFHPFDDETRIDLVVMADGTYEVGGRGHGDFDSIYAALWWATTIFGREGGEGALSLADADVVVFAAPDVKLAALFTMLQAGSTSTVCINRFHLAVADRESGEEGSLPFFLPTEVGVRPGDAEAGSDGPDRFEITLRSEGNGPEYGVTRLGTDERASFDSLDELAGVLEAIDETEAGAQIVFALRVTPGAAGDPESRRATVQHLADLLGLLTSHGADLTRRQAGRVTRRMLIEETDSEGNK